MGYKTILVHCDASKGIAGRLDAALELGQRFDAHVVGLHVRRRFEAPMFTDGGFAMDSLYQNYEESVKAEETAASELFNKAVGRFSTPSTEWRVVDGYLDDALGDEARFADLILVGQADPETAAIGTPGDLAESVALSTGRPVLVVPHIGLAKPPGKVVMLCWNGSREAARAASDALPFLKKAEKVVLLTIDPESADDGGEAIPGVEAAEWLARHGVKVTVQRDVAANTDVGDVILSRAADLDIDLIVMGIYGHSRMRELVLGGASRTLLASMTAPLLISH
jgi:nucleotide-binding universal stress UspA family protein